MRPTASAELGATAQAAARRVTPAPVDEGWVAAVLRPLVYLVAAFVFAFPLATPAVARAIAGAALLGGLLGRPLARSSLRLPTIGALAAAGVGVAAWLRATLLDAAALARWLGPAEALETVSACAFAAIALWIAASLRAAALRQRLFRIAEVGFVAVAFAQALAAHRGGAINRPFELADSILAAGGDPEVALLAVGAIAAGLCVIVLLGERRPLRALLHLSLVALLLMLVPSGAGLLALPAPPIPPGPMSQKPQHKGDEGNGQGKRSEQNNNEQLEFRDNYDAPGRLIPLAVVLLHDDYSPPNGLYYFRQSAFSQYNGRRLVVASQPGIDDDLAPGFVFEATRIAGAPSADGERRPLETTVALLADHGRPFALEAPLSLSPEQNPDPGRFRRVYRVKSAVLSVDFEDLIGLPAGAPGWSSDKLEHYTTAPPDPRYRALAERIASGIPDDLRDDPMARAVAISLYLSQEGIYSLKSKHAGAADPTADFLFGDKTGYCVHFAHAAVYLMRALGLPARVGAGYVYQESARQGGSAMLLSGANAHAWPEVYLQGVGWVVVDVSPERALDPAIQPPDADLQRLLGEMARGLSPLPPSESRPFTPVAEAVSYLPRALGRALLFGLPLCLLVLYAIKLWRRLVGRLPLRAAARLTYRAELDRLAELSLTRRFGESRELFAERVRATAPSFRPLTAQHVAAAFGRHDPDRKASRALARALRRELRAHFTRRRRLLGLLHPWSWLHSR